MICNNLHRSILRYSVYDTDIEYKLERLLITLIKLELGRRRRPLDLHEVKILDAIPTARVVLFLSQITNARAAMALLFALMN